MSESSWNTKKTSEGAVLPEDVRPTSMSARHDTDIMADQLDKDLMECAVKPVRPVSLCVGKTSLRFRLLKVELKKENIEKNTPALSISGRITLHIIVKFFGTETELVNFFGNETEFESLFCVGRRTSFECSTYLTLQCQMTHGHRATMSKRTFVSTAVLCSV